MFGRTRPAVGLVWGPGLSEVPGGSNAGVTADCPWGGGGTWGTGTPAMGLAGGPRVVNDTGQGGVPRHRCALGKRRRGWECRGVPRWL